jgi:PIN domain nuclease of toxin-antitoxin system
VTIILDTHTFLWFIAGDAKLSAHARSLIEDPSNRVLLSIVSLWEIVVKVSTGKLPISRSFADLIRVDVDDNGIEVLPTTLAHLEMLASLPLHHRDPFDRLLIAQSNAEGVPILEMDSAFDQYAVTRLW